MRVHIVDPSAYTPPYDHALCRALGAAGADVELYTSRFAHGPVPPADGYRRCELFYRLAARVGDPRARRAVKLAEHVPDMLRYRRAARVADVVHFQWLAVQHVDGHLLPPRRSTDGARRPLVLTAHDILPREARPGQRVAQRRLYDHFDAVVAHSEHGRRRLTEELGVDAERVHVIAHGVFEHLAADGLSRGGIDGGDAPPPFATDKPVVLCFGLMRPYKGIDLLLEAWRGIEGAELWIAGAPRMDISPLQAMAPPGVRFVPRFITDSELPPFFRRADLVVLPYREIDQSGVLFTALAFAKPLLLSDVGGFPEIAATGAARMFPAGDAAALHAALLELLADAPVRAEMASRAGALAAGQYSWREIAQCTLELYESLLHEGPSR
ncbi:MAG TPA: glycosyltransferase family 4 protein [Solirubrobacteraceae bacterium]|jgi:glycosyltransferase involved in cell wall biosynthesis|nr:glycosyltransferase family 4 protein [Solirubrobacteraceae bacterium]